MFQSIFQYIAKALAIPLIAILSSAGYSPVQPQIVKVGSIPQYVAATPTTLYGYGVASTDTSIRLTKLVTPDGTAITTNQLVGGASGTGSVFYGTIEPATSRKETISCTGVTQNSDTTATLTGCTRGLAFTYPYTAVTSLAIPHAGGAAFVISNSPQLYNDIQTMIASSSASGASDASLSIKGIVQLSTGAQAASHTAIGGGSTSAGLVLYTGISSSTRTANTAQVVISNPSTGYIDSSYISTSTLISSSTSFINGIPLMNIGKNYLFATSSQPFYTPSGVNFVDVQCVGGGGGGGASASGSSYSIGGGGGGGAYIRGVANLTGIATTTITIGAGGASASNGNNTTFGSFFTANGGTAATNASGGGQFTVVGGAGGTAAALTASSSVISLPGSNGFGGFVTAPTSNVLAKGGDGGSSFFGSGGIDNYTGTGNAYVGTAAPNYGAGGGGGLSTNNSSNAGGAGASGACFITW